MAITADDDPVPRLGGLDLSDAVRRYQLPLLRSAARRLGDLAAAEDAVQETFLRAHKAQHRFVGDDPRPWLHTILANVCFDEVARRSRERTKVDRAVALTDVDRPFPGADEVLTDRLVDPRLADAFDDLSPEYREALVLRVLHGLSYDEVARRAGITEQNARARVSRATRVLRQIVRGVAAVPALVAGSWLRRPEGAAAAGRVRPGDPALAQGPFAGVTHSSAGAAGSIGQAGSAFAPVAHVVPAAVPATPTAAQLVASAVPLAESAQAAVAVAAPAAVPLAAKAVVGLSLVAAAAAPAAPALLDAHQEAGIAAEAQQWPDTILYAPGERVVTDARGPAATAATPVTAEPGTAAPPAREGGPSELTRSPVALATSPPATPGRNVAAAGRPGVEPGEVKQQPRRTPSSAPTPAMPVSGQPAPGSAPGVEPASEPVGSPGVGDERPAGDDLAAPGDGATSSAPSDPGRDAGGPTSGGLGETPPGGGSVPLRSPGSVETAQLEVSKAGAQVELAGPASLAVGGVTISGEMSGRMTLSARAEGAPLALQGHLTLVLRTGDIVEIRLDGQVDPPERGDPIALEDRVQPADDQAGPTHPPTGAVPEPAPSTSTVEPPSVAAPSSPPATSPAPGASAGVAPPPARSKPSGPPDLSVEVAEPPGPAGRSTVSGVFEAESSTAVALLDSGTFFGVLDIAAGSMTLSFSV